MINLDNFGFGVHTVPTRDGSEAYRLHTPFTIIKDFPLEIYVQLIGNRVRFFDEGFNLHSLLAMGIVFDSKSRWSSLKRVVEKRQAILSDHGQIELFAPIESIRIACASYIQTLCDIGDWVIELNSQQKRSKEELIKRALLAFKALKPQDRIIENPVVAMKNEKDIKFDFSINEQEFIDILFPDSVWPFVRKVAHMRIIHPTNTGLGVVEDINNPKQAKIEQKAAGSFVPMICYSRLLTSMNTPSAFAIA